MALEDITIPFPCGYCDGKVNFKGLMNNTLPHRTSYILGGSAKCDKCGKEAKIDEDHHCVIGTEITR